MTSCAAITFDFINECGATTGCNVTLHLIGV